jgi:hypothetical protein
MWVRSRSGPIFSFDELTQHAGIDGWQSKPAVKPLIEYLISRLPASSPFRNLLVSTSSPQSKNRIALVVSERLVNLPVQIMPPLWKMTIDEVEKARKEVGPGWDLTSREGVGNADRPTSIVL